MSQSNIKATSRLCVAQTTLDGVTVITPPTVFEDFRGCYIETYNREIYNEAGIDIDFIQDDVSISKKNVLRGIHGDRKTWKLISCLWGEFQLVVVNWDEESEQFMKWESFILSDVNRKQVLVPPSFGNGHYVISEKAMFQYKQSTQYDRSTQFTILWNDPRLNIQWPTTNPTLSARDSATE